MTKLKLGILQMMRKTGILVAPNLLFMAYNYKRIHAMPQLRTWSTTFQDMSDINYNYIYFMSLLFTNYRCYCIISFIIYISCLN